DVGKRLNDVRSTVDGDDGDPVARREQPDDFRRAEIGEIHFHEVAANGHRHAAGAIESDGDRNAILAVLFTQLHRHGQHRVQRTVEVAAHAETAATTGKHQTPAEIFD